MINGLLRGGGGGGKRVSKVEELAGNGRAFYRREISPTKDEIPLGIFVGRNGFLERRKGQKTLLPRLLKTTHSVLPRPIRVRHLFLAICNVNAIHE